MSARSPDPDYVPDVTGPRLSLPSRPSASPPATPDGTDISCPRIFSMPTLTTIVTFTSTIVRLDRSGASTGRNLGIDGSGAGRSLRRQLHPARRTGCAGL